MASKFFKFNFNQVFNLRKERLRKENMRQELCSIKSKCEKTFQKTNAMFLFYLGNKNN